jgi:hypothetical protein
MKQASIVYKNPEDCKAAALAMACQRKVTGAQEVFLGNGVVHFDSVAHFTNDKQTVVHTRSPKGTTKPRVARTVVGSEIDAYYVSGSPETPQSQLEAANAIANGVDPRRITGKILDVGFTQKGDVCIKVTNALRTSADGNPSFRTLNPKTGILVAMAIGRGLGIPADKLKADGDKYERLLKGKATGPVLPGMEEAVGVEPAEGQASEALAEDVKPAPEEEPKQTMVDITMPEKEAIGNQATEAPAQAEVVEPAVEIVEPKEEPVNPLIAKLRALSNESLGMK